MRSRRNAAEGTVGTNWNAAERRLPVVTPEPARKEFLADAGFGVLLLFLILSYSRIFDFKASYLHLPLITSLIAFTITILSGRLQYVFASPIGICLSAFTVWLIFAIPFSVWQGGSFHVFTELWSKSFLLFVMMACLIRTVRQCRLTMYGIAGGVLVVVAMCLYFRNTVEDGRLRLPDGMLSNPNDVAQVLLMGMPFLIFMMIRKHGLPFQRILAALCLLPLFIVLFKTGSRGGLLTLAVICLLSFARASLASKVKLAGAVMLIAAICVPLLPQNIRDRYRTVYTKETVTDESVATESSEERYQLLLDSLKLTFRHPLVGVGPGQFQTASMEVSKASQSYVHWRETHNMYTQVSSEEGLPAAFFYIAALVYCFKELGAVRKMYRGALSLLPEAPSPSSTSQDLRAHYDEISAMAFCLSLSLIAIAIFGFFSSTAYHFFFPTLAGLIAGFGRAARAELSASDIKTARVAQPTWARASVAMRPAVTV
ncbi:MAG: O-antigen polymerase [Bryobacterales bacterium]|nr:O-antigen polymerase [Bryobacterales bacterium]